jgi:acyl carrier protein
MEMEEDIELRVKRFIASTGRIKIERIRDGTTLMGDLGIDGDDAEDFFAEFRDELGVDLSLLDLSSHFGPEGLWPWTPIKWLIDAFRGGTPEHKNGLIAITVADLIHAARTGKWEPERLPTAPAR